jgi:FkbM family methyltransferase
MNSYSQFGQDLNVINNIYKQKYNGFFVDIGAYDGKDMSNTYLLEKEYNWKGICIEPNPRYFSKILECRTSINLDCAVYTNDNEEVEFIDDNNGGCSGLVKTNSHIHILHEPIIKVKTRNLTSILDEYNAPRFIEYLSIDTEGSEYDILKSHDFDKYRFGYISVEHNFIEQNRTKINNLLIEKGYILYRENNVDDEYIFNRQKGIFYNSKKAECSIYESGLMVYNCLKLSNLYTLDYTEDNNFLYEYDFAVVNEHIIVNNWVTKEMIYTFKKPVFCVVTEISFTDNYIDKSPNFYSAYILLDSSINDHNNLYSFARPLEDNIQIEYKENNIPIIGSFGYPTVGKQWDLIVKEVQNEFDEAIIRFNIPYATYIPDNEIRINEVKEMCDKIINKPNIKLIFSHNNFSKEELVKWCSENTINCFFYCREHIFSNGLCATADQAIVAEKPLLVSGDKTFRHIHDYIDFYPNISIKEAINSTLDGVKKMKNDWSSKNFCNKFEHILNIYTNKSNQHNISIYYHTINYTEAGNVSNIFNTLYNKFQNNKDNYEFRVENNIFTDTCFGSEKTLFINIKSKKNGIITLTYKEGEIVNFNSIMSILNLYKVNNLDEDQNMVNVSIGEIMDKYSILELKKKYIIDQTKLNDIKNEMDILQKYKDNINNNNNNIYFYKLLLHINELIWHDTDLIKTLSLDNTDYPNIILFAETSNKIFENNQKRFRLKNYFNILEKTTIKEHKSYQNNVCFIQIDDETTIYNKLSEINYIFILHDIIYIDVKYKELITKIFVNPNIEFVETNANFTTIYDLQTYNIDPNLIDTYDFEPISYNSGGLFGDFLNQLSIVAEKFYDTGRKGLLYISNEGEAFRNGLDVTYNDTYNIISKLIYIKEYKIFNNQNIDIKLSNWRNYHCFEDNLHQILYTNYKINWAKHQWLYSNIDSKWTNKILINISPYRTFTYNSLSLFLKAVQPILSDCVFVSNEKEWYDDFVIKTGLNIDFYQTTSFEETLTIVNSSKMGYFGYSSMAVIANALHKKHILLSNGIFLDYKLNNLKGVIPHILDIFI